MHWLKMFDVPFAESTLTLQLNWRVYNDLVTLEAW